MEFVRFGGTIPGEYHGCCAVDVIQNFKEDPDTPASIQLVEGDSGSGITNNGELAFLGPTLRDIFWNRLRISTFGMSDHPNKAFLAVLEESQLHNNPGKKWLALLKEAGFEFIRRIDNSVYTGSTLGGKGSPHTNYLFGLFRNIGNGFIEDPFTPPKAWTDLPDVVPEAWEYMNKHPDGLDPADYCEARPFEPEVLADEQRKAHRKIWDAHGPTKIMTLSEVEKSGAPIIMAGLRTEFPPEPKTQRDEKLQKRKEANNPFIPSSGTQHLYHR